MRTLSRLVEPNSGAVGKAGTLLQAHDAPGVGAAAADPIRIVGVGRSAGSTARGAAEAVLERDRADRRGWHRGPGQTG